MNNPNLISESHVICPYCGYKDNGWEYKIDDIYTCKNCGKSFKLQIKIKRVFKMYKVFEDNNDIYNVYSTDELVSKIEKVLDELINEFNIDKKDISYIYEKSWKETFVKDVKNVISLLISENKGTGYITLPIGCIENNNEWDISINKANDIFSVYVYEGLNLQDSYKFKLKKL